MVERNADMQQARAKSGDEADAYAIALKVMAAHRAKYEKMSKLHSPDPLPTPTIDSSGGMHFDLTMDGHAVVLLQLEGFVLTESTGDLGPVSCSQEFRRSHQPLFERATASPLPAQPPRLGDRSGPATGSIPESVSGSGPAGK
jgi:hypothetical protein